MVNLQEEAPEETHVARLGVVEMEEALQTELLEGLQEGDLAPLEEPSGSSGGGGTLR